VQLDTLLLFIAKRSRVLKVGALAQVLLPIVHKRSVLVLRLSRFRGANPAVSYARNHGASSACVAASRLGEELFRKTDGFVRLLAVRVVNFTVQALDPRGIVGALLREHQTLFVGSGRLLFVQG